MKALRALILLAPVTLLAAGGLALAARGKIDYLDQPVPQWREGPVRYIITKWEDDEYKSLKTQEDRARFIEAFWRRRDPTPESPGNEFRAEFWRRVRDANRLYAEMTANEGWRTDMGKIHILKGPPDDITRDLMGAGNRGTVVWTYRNSGTPGVGPNAVVAFARDESGEFRLSVEPSKDADPRQGSALNYQPALGINAMQKRQVLQGQAIASRAFNLTDPLIRQAGGPVFASQLTLVTELAKLQQPPKEWELRETVTTQELFGSVPIRARADFFRTTTSRTLVVLTAGVGSAAVRYRSQGGRDLPDVVLYARVMDLTGNELVQSLEKDGDFVPARENETATLDDDLVFQARVLLEPGSYKVSLTALDRAGGRAGSYIVPLTVPSFKDGALMLSSLQLARSIESTAAPAEPNRAPGAFVMGGLRILPRLGQTFAVGDELAFYYQVYGASLDPATSKPSLDVDYAFLTADADAAQDLGHVSFTDQTYDAHGYALSLKEWPPGPYLMRVSVTDRIAKATATREMVFEIR